MSFSLEKYFQEVDEKFADNVAGGIDAADMRDQLKSLGLLSLQNVIDLERGQDQTNNQLATLATRLATLNVLGLGAVGDGKVINDKVFSQAFLAQFEQTLFVPRAVYKFTKGQVMDISQVKLLGDRALLDFSACTDPVALLIKGSGLGDPYDNCVNILQSLRIKGPGVAAGTKGVVLDTPTEGGTSHFSLDQVSISGFAINVELRENAYCQNFTRFNSYNAGIALHAPGGFGNAGERISFSQCTIFNSTLGVKAANPNADIFCSECSFDYNGRHVESYNTLIEFHGCHFEGKNFTQPVILATGWGANLKFFGGRFLSTENTVKATAIVQCDDNATMRFYSPDLSNIMTSGRFFATGTARRNVKVYDPVGYEVPNVPLHVSDLDNQFLDGLFSQGSLVDNWTVYGTGTRISTTLLRSGDGNPEVSATLSTAKKMGANTQSLKFSKRYGSGSAGSINVSIPIGRKRPFTSFISLLPAAGVTGNVFVSFQLAAGYYIDANGFPSYRRSVEVALYTINLANVSDWVTQDMLNRWYQPDGWADSLIISINASLMSAGDLFIGGLQVSSY